MANGSFSGGDGTSGNPYIVEDVLDLDAVRNNLASYFKVKNDIDMISISNWAPILNFTGTFDGNGYKIKNLTCSYPTTDYAGLFGTVNGATLKNIGLENVNIEGNNYVGALVCYLPASSNLVTITNCYATGVIKCNYRYAGGLIGYLTAPSTGKNVVSNCYSSVTITANAEYSYTGGFVGMLYGTNISYCYSSSNVSLTDNNAVYVRNGTFFGYTSTSDCTYTGLYFDVDASSYKTEPYAKATSLTTTLAKTQSSYAGYSFTGTWLINSGYNNGYPALSVFIYQEGTGSSSTPFIIKTLTQLNSIRYMDKTLCYKLANDIDASDTSNSTNWPNGGFQPILPYSANVSYNGTIDGDFHRIKNLYMNNTIAETYFGFISNLRGTIKNLIFENPTIISTEHTGVIFGICVYSLVENCAVIGGSVTASYAGGIGGRANGETTVKNCYNTATINGSSFAGGIVDYTVGNATIQDCYNAGNIVTSSNQAGGIVGQFYVGAGQYQNITRCYNSGNVSGKGAIAGNYSQTITDCYYDSQTSNTTYGIMTGTTTGFTALTTTQMKDKANYLNWDFNMVWVIKDGEYPKISNFYEGSGTPADPYLVGNLNQLDRIRNDLFASYKLFNDIDATPTSTWNTNTGWIGYGGWQKEFRGVIDGDGHIIKNLYVNRNTEKQGFISWLFGEIKNLGFENANITANGVNSIGVVVGYTGGDNTVVGGNTNMIISNCYVKDSTVTASNNNTGGFGGYMGGSLATNCYALNVTISSTDITGNIGGFAGSVGRATNCYSASNLRFNGGGWETVTNCFYDSTLAGVAACKATAKATTELKTQSTYTSWDFANIWRFTSGQYPSLKSFPVPVDTTPPGEATNLSAIYEAGPDRIVVYGTYPNDPDINQIRAYVDGESTTLHYYPCAGQAGSTFTFYELVGVSTTVSHSIRMTIVDTSGNESAGATVIYIPANVDTTINSVVATVSSSILEPTLLVVKNNTIQAVVSDNYASNPLPSISAQIITGYIVEKSDNGVDFYTLKTLPIETRTLDDTDVVIGNTYYYRIKEFGDSVQSNWSNVVSLQVSPDAPKVTITFIATGDDTPNEPPYETSKLDSLVNVKFSFDRDIQVWQIEVGGIGYGTGTFLTSGGSAISGSEINTTFDINSASSYFDHDGNYRINIYGQDTLGNWTRYE